MLRIIFLLLLSTSFLQLNAKAEVEMQWKKANEYYAKNQYDSAIQQYAQIIKDSLKTADVYYNLGNAYFRLNHFDKAVICYKIAHLKDYWNMAIKDNLNLAKSKQIKPTPEVNPIFFERWWQNLIYFIPPIAWAITSFLLFLVILYSIFAQKTGRKTIPYFNRFMAAYISVFILLLVLAFASTNALQQDKMEVIKLEQELNL